MAKYTEDQILHDIKIRPTVKIWPHYRWAHDVKRGKAYQLAAKAGPDEIVTLPGGTRSVKRALTGPLRKKLQIES